MKCLPQSTRMIPSPSGSSFTSICQWYVSQKLDTFEFQYVYHDLAEPAFCIQDITELVTNIWPLNGYSRCGWGGCNFVAVGGPGGGVSGFATHLNAFHIAKEDQRIPCLWGNCGVILDRNSIIGHIFVHVGGKWRCPRCFRSYTRSDLMRRHWDNCNAA